MLNVRAVKQLFAVYTDKDHSVHSWIGWHPRLRTLRVTWPWFWGTVGVDLDLRHWRAYGISAWRERTMQEDRCCVPNGPPRDLLTGLPLGKSAEDWQSAYRGRLPDRPVR